ncbi:hypothetical protein BKA64DRAFT_766741 [Cadophora sp. MPI-SDFR-AT-0126]|nr:hypothetical protein BKA64DRAFT_766741 [Leotiomycetes sp. MPI-SDFR-AT-0126]
MTRRGRKYILSIYTSIFNLQFRVSELSIQDAQELCGEFIRSRIPSRGKCHVDCKSIIQILARLVQKDWQPALKVVLMPSLWNYVLAITYRWQHDSPCEGNMPCRRCTTRVKISECIHEVHIKDAKEELVKQINELRTKFDMTERILKALSTDEKESQILERLKTGDTFDSIVEWLRHSSTVDFETLSSRKSHGSMFTASDADVGGVGSSKSS